MNKVNTLLLGCLVSLVLTSFCANSLSTEEQVTIKVTAGTPTKFDLFNNSEVSKDLMTPYEITVAKTDRNFLVKSLNNAVIKVEVGTKKGTIIMGEWPVVVLLVRGGKVSTFGL